MLLYRLLCLRAINCFDKYISLHFEFVPRRDFIVASKLRMCNPKLDTILKSSASIPFSNLCEVMLIKPYSVLSDRV